MAEPLQLKDHSVEAQIFASRLGLVAIIVLIAMGALAARYFNLQVTHHQEYATQSDRNRVHVLPLPPTRGLIYDRNGVLLAENRASKTLNIIKERAPDLDQTLAVLGDLVEISERDLERFQSALQRRRRPYEAVPLRLNLNEVEVARLAVNEYRLEGVSVDSQLVRHYPFGELFAHSIGYVGRINDQEVSSFDEEQYRAYQGTNTIGKIGIEKQYEELLLGQVGLRQVEINAHGRILREIDAARENPSSGRDLHLYLDVEVQKVAAEAMAGKRGAVVAIDPRNGGVIAMVSTPSFDPNLFVTGISEVDFRAINENIDSPLLNRVVQGHYSPGSTLKPMLGLAGLQFGFITPNSTINDNGYFRVEGTDRALRDWSYRTGGHGPGIDIIKAISQSCNTYFWDLANRMGIEKIHAFGSQFGLGQQSGIDIPNESRGIWPSDQWKQGARGQRWFDGDTLNVAVGQGFVVATPLQLANMTATLATRGQRHVPRLVKSLNLPGDTTIARIDVDSQNWDVIYNGMITAVNGASGTARSARSKNFTLAAKTGTAQLFSVAADEEYVAEEVDKRLRDQALFVGFAPAENPTLAITVLIENGESSKFAAPIVLQVMDTYFASEKRRAVRHPEDN